MALVPTANPENVVTASPEPATARANDYQHIDASPEDFGTQIAAVARGVGGQIEGAGGGLAQTALAQAALNNETAARDASTKFMGDMATKAADFFTKKGQNAVAAYPQFISDLAAAQKAAAGTMSNPQAAEMFSAATQRLMAHYTEAAATHLKTETVNGNIDSSKSRIGALADQAVVFRNDPNKVDAYVNGIGAEMHNLGEINGWDPDTLKQQTTKAQGAAYEKVIMSLAVDNPLGAQSLFDRVRDKLDASDALKISEHLKPKVDAEGDKQWLQGQTATTYSLPGNVDFQTLWNANESIESRHLQFDPKTGKPLVSSAGAVGVSQIEPDTAKWTAGQIGADYDEQRLYNDANYNRQMGQEHFKLLLQKYGNPALARLAYAAGMGNADKWLAQYGDPRTGAISYQDFLAKIPSAEARTTTQDFMNRVGAAIGTATPGQVPKKDLVTAALNSSSDIDVQLRRATLASRYASLVDAKNGQQRSELMNEITQNIAPALEAGHDEIEIPEARIRSVLEPDKADRVVADLQYTKMAGQAFKQVANATPQELAEMRQDLETGQGVLSGLLKGKGALLIGVGADGKPIDTSKADFAVRQKMASTLETLIQKRNEALKTDPAAYVATNDPTVQAALKAVQDGNDPQAMQKYATATMAAQERLGVPEALRAVLPGSMIDALASKFRYDDPSKADPGPVIQSMQEQFGAVWPKVFGQLVTKGHMPDEAAITAVLNGPDAGPLQGQGQDVVRQDYIRAWQAAGKKGEQKLEESIDPQDKAAINKDIDQRLSAFRSTIMVPGVSAAQNVDAYTQFRSGVKLLASYYSLQGLDGDRALDKAINGMVGAKWDLGDTYRTPKGMIAQTENAMSAVQSGLKVEDIRDPGAIPGSKEAALDPDKRKQLWLGGKKLWVNNEAGDGVVMRVQGRDGSVQPIFRNDGSRVELKFADIAKQPASAGGAPAPAPMAWTVP